MPITDKDESMITTELLNDIAQRCTGINPAEWLEEEGIAPGVMLDFQDSKIKALALLIGLGNDVSESLRASTAASFQTGWEAHKLAALPPNVFQMLDAALKSAEQTTTMGSALAEALDVAIDALQNGTDTDAALDQAQAILLAGYEAAYPGEDPRAL